MSYNYANEKAKIFTEEGQRSFLQFRDKAQALLKSAGAFMWCKVLISGAHDSWTLLAYVDRMVELGEIIELSQKNVPGQYRVFMSAHPGS